MAAAIESLDGMGGRHAELWARCPDLYDALRAIAHRERRRNPSDTLNTTVIVNEAWLKLQHGAGQWQDRRHYLATAALAMRQLLVDYARRRHADKRTPVDFFPLCEDAGAPTTTGVAMLALDQALGHLEKLEPRLTQLVELRFFAGLTLPEAADCLRISVRTANREWNKARAFLLAAMPAC